LEVDGNIISSNFGRRGKVSTKFGFDKVLGQDATNEDVIRLVGQPIKDQLLQGINVTCIAYGQTSSGKTHTISGSQEELGITPNMISILMDEAGDLEFEVRYGELYLSKLYDLTKKQRKRIENIKNWKYEKVERNPEDLLERLKKWDKQRKTSGTKMNARSSRSHAIFSIRVTRTIGSKKLRGVLTMVDLAGSENSKKTNAQGKQIDEASDVNKSLLLLTKVIRELGRGKNVLDWRTHKLGELLKPTLTQNDATPKCLIITCVDPSTDQSIETRNSLNFAKNCKNVKIKAKINSIKIEKDTAVKLLLEEQRKENEKQRQLDKEEREKCYAEQIKREEKRAKEQLAREEKRNEDQKKFQVEMAKSQQTFQENLVDKMQKQHIEGMKQITQMLLELNNPRSPPHAPDRAKPKVKPPPSDSPPALAKPEVKELAAADDLEEPLESPPKKRNGSQAFGPVSMPPAKKQCRRSFHWEVERIDDYKIDEEKLYLQLKFTGSTESVFFPSGDVDDGDLKRSFFIQHPELKEFDVVDVPVEKILTHRWGKYPGETEIGLHYKVKYADGEDSWLPESQMRPHAMKDAYDLRHPKIASHLGLLD